MLNATIKEKNGHRPKCLFIGFGDMNTMLTEALGHHQSGRPKEAEALYRQILEVDPDHPEALHLLGALALQAGHGDKAIRFMERSLELNPGNASALNNLGQAFKSLGRLDDEIAVYRKAIAMVPDFAEAQSNLGDALMVKGNPEEAIDCYEIILKSHPDEPEVLNTLGSVLASLGKLKDAIAHLRHALRITPEDPVILTNLGNALQESGKPEEAVTAFERALAADPNFVEAHYNLGMAYHDQMRPDDAVASYQKVLSLDPDYAEAHLKLGWALYAIGREDEAEQCYHRALELNPDLTDAYFTLAQRLHNVGKYEETAAAYRQGYATRRGVRLAPNEERFLGIDALFLELTNKCNFHCDFCPSDSQTRVHGYMDLDLAKRLYDEASEKSLATVVNLHVMGEPTLHPRLNEILAYGASKNVETHLTTNGSTLVAKIVPRILDTLYGTLVISLMTPTRDTYHFRGKVGLTWERYIENIRSTLREYLKRLGDGKAIRSTIELRVMVTKDSSVCVDIIESSDEAHAILNEWYDFTAEVERELGMAPFNRKELNPDGLLGSSGERALKKYQLQHGVVLSLWEAFTFANSRVSDEYDLQEEEEAKFCSLPFTQLGILWNGDVTMCCLDYDGDLVVGNIKDSSIETMLNSEAANRVRASMFGRSPLADVCRKCQAKAVQRDEPETPKAGFEAPHSNTPHQSF